MQKGVPLSSVFSPTAMYDAFYHRLLSRIDPERAHGLAVRMLEGVGQRQSLLRTVEKRFSTSTTYPPVIHWNQTFSHPLGLAGGFDKEGRCLPSLVALGFSFIEIGTVTPQPRLFRLPEDQALINRMGFPSAGMDALAARLGTASAMCVPLWISLGKNKDTPLTDAANDYLTCLNRLHALGDSFVVNISSPNTPELRKLQTRDYLADLLAALTNALQSRTAADNRPSPKPLFLKISPDLTWPELDSILELALNFGVSGIIATNTTVERPDLKSLLQTEPGGLSGQPLRERSNQMIRYIYRHAERRLLIVGVGGIFTGNDLWDKLAAGASLTQAYTGFIYRGPGFVRSVLREFAARMLAESVHSPAEIIGTTP
jgi:dihydroorotate dehydrogenase